MWPNLYSQWLACQLTINYSINFAKKVELVKNKIFDKLFKTNIIIQCNKKTLKEERKNKTGLVLWTDGSKLDQNQDRTAVCWEDKLTGG